MVSLLENEQLQAEVKKLRAERSDNERKLLAEVRELRIENEGLHARLGIKHARNDEAFEFGMDEMCESTMDVGGMTNVHENEEGLASPPSPTPTCPGHCHQDCKLPTNRRRYHRLETGKALMQIVWPAQRCSAISKSLSCLSGLRTGLDGSSVLFSFFASCFEIIYAWPLYGECLLQGT